MRKAGKSVIKITVLFAKVISQLAKLGFTIYTIRLALSWFVILPWLAYISIYFFSLAI